MSKTSAFIVTLSSDVSEEIRDQLARAISVFRYVESVAPVEADPTELIARIRVKSEYRDKIWKFFEDLMQ